MFCLPEITHPLSIDTIGKLLATGHEMVVYCHTPGCRHDGRLNMVTLARRLGMDHGCLDEDLRPYVYCPRCRAEGRPDNNFTFRLCTAEPYSKWPRERNN